MNAWNDYIEQPLKSSDFDGPGRQAATSDQAELAILWSALLGS